MLLKNISFFSNAGIGEYGNNLIKGKFNGKEYKVETIIANELLEERANIFSSNYSNCNMIIGDISNKSILNNIIKESIEKEPIIATISPPCQGSSGLNATKGQIGDIRNQLIKYVFQYFDKYNGLEFGYIENVTSYFSEYIPGKKEDLLGLKSELINFILHNEDYSIVNSPYFIVFKKDLKEEYRLNIIDTLGKDKDLFFKGFINGENINQCVLSCLDVEMFTKSLNDFKEYVEYYISPIKLKDYIEGYLSKYGYGYELKNIRGEEYGSPQIRIRGFLIFYKKELDIKFPKKIFNSYKNEIDYKGKTIEDAFLINNLLIKLNKDEHNINELINKYGKEKVSIKDNFIYIDNAKKLSEFKNDYNNWLENSENFIKPHFYTPLTKRQMKWCEQIKEGSSAYFNDSFIYRPYTIQQIIKNEENDFLLKRNNDIIIDNENNLNKIFENKIIFYYKNFLSYEYKIKEKDFLEYYIKNNTLIKSKGVRNHMIYDIKRRENLKKDIESFIKYLILKKDFGDLKCQFIQNFTQLELYKLEKTYNNLLLDIQNKSNLEYFYVISIKGFEHATYKRGFLNKPSSAITTKMGFGNSNTVHPIFNRVLTPMESLSLFGIGYTYNHEKNIYEKNIDYIFPKSIFKNKGLVNFGNTIYEISGEAIISIVAKELLENIVKQYLK